MYRCSPGHGSPGSGKRGTEMKDSHVITVENMKNRVGGNQTYVRVPPEKSLEEASACHNVIQPTRHSKEDFWAKKEDLTVINMCSFRPIESRSTWS